MQVLTGVLILIVLGVAVAIVGTMTSVHNMRRLAAWLIGRAMYRENLDAERERCREIGEETRRDMERTLGIA